jgi:tetratricopeptide (TPR) repeat protein
MEFWNRRLFATLAICSALALGGCEPSGQSDSDDTMEPHFVLGQSRVNAMDYQGAVEAFEQALEVNPHSAQAHYQLAMLYEQKESDPAAAIYHYQEYLKFDPNAPNADVVNQRITGCKQQLAADVMAMPTAPAAMKQIEQLTETNQMLQEQLKQWQAYANQLAAAAKTNPPVAQNNFQPRQAENPVPAETAQRASTNPRPRTHTIVAGDTLAAIARKSGVNLNVLLAANPGLDPKKLRIGQAVNIPPQ